jgi:hypothetical protein
VPNSNEIYFIKEADDKNKHIYFADPETFETRVGPVLDESWDWNGIWVGDPKDGVIAFVDNGEGEERVTSIVVGDLNTVEKTVLFKLGQSTYVEILAWLP